MRKTRRRLVVTLFLVAIASNGCQSPEELNAELAAKAAQSDAELAARKRVADADMDARTRGVETLASKNEASTAPLDVVEHFRENERIAYQVLHEWPMHVKGIGRTIIVPPFSRTEENLRVLGNQLWHDTSGNLFVKIWIFDGSTGASSRDEHSEHMVGWYIKSVANGINELVEANTRRDHGKPTTCKFDTSEGVTFTANGATRLRTDDDDPEAGLTDTERRWKDAISRGVVLIGMSEDDACRAASNGHHGLGPFLESSTTTASGVFRHLSYSHGDGSRGFDFYTMNYRVTMIQE